MTNSVQWLTTAPNPRVRGYGADDGQRGWRTHAVIAYEEQSLTEIANYRALCGLRARHGWGIDLFIEQKCARCLRALNAKAPVEPLKSTNDQDLAVLRRAGSDKVTP